MIDEPFPPDVLETMLAIERCNSSSFLDLVNAAGLDPKKDFKNADLREVDLRGADLREFAFQQADLRQAIIDENTQLPDHEAFIGAKVDFVHEAIKEPIVSVMARAQAQPVGSRQPYLDVLVRDYDSPHHIDEFLVSLLSRSRAANAAVEVIPYFSTNLEDHLEARATREIGRVLSNTLTKRPPKKKVGAKSPVEEVVKAVLALEKSPLERAARLAKEYSRNNKSLEELVLSLAAGI